MKIVLIKIKEMDPPEKKKRPRERQLHIIRTGVKVGGKRKEPKYRAIKLPGMRRVLVPAEKKVEEEISNEDEALFEVHEPEYTPDIENLEADLETGDDDEAPLNFQEEPEYTPGIKDFDTSISDEPEELKRYREMEQKLFLEEGDKGKSLGIQEQVERIVEYEQESVPIPLSTRQKELLMRMRIKIPRTTRQLVGRVRVRPVRRLELTYEDTTRGYMGPFGTIIPYKSGRPTKLIGDVLPKHMQPTTTPKTRVLTRGPVAPTTFRRKKMDVSSYYDSPVTQEIRKAVIQMIFEIVSEKRIPITSTRTDKPKEVILGRPLLPGLIRENISDTPPPKIPKNVYKKQELHSIVKKDIYATLRPQIPKEKLMEEAVNIIQKKKDIETILNDLERRLGKTLMEKMWSWDANLLWERLQNLNEETELEIIFRLFLQDKTLAERKRIRGDRFRALIIKAIDLYRSRLEVQTNEIYSHLESQWLRSEFEKKFKEKETELLKRWSNKLDTAWKKYSVEYDKKYGDVGEGGKLTKAGQEIYKQIQEMEQGFFDQSISTESPLTLFEYLSRVLFPVLFLDTIGDIGRYAKFFHTKLQTGSIKIRALPKANLAHYIPEVTMKYLNNMDSIDWEIIEQRLQQDLKKRVDEFIALVMIRKGIRVSLPPPLENFSWFRYISDPQDICFKDTKSGYFYNKDGTKRKIPDSDLIICYTDDIGFTCHSVYNVLLAGVEGTPNPFTGKPYPHELIQRMKRQHPATLQDIEKRMKLVEELFDEEAED